MNTHRNLSVELRTGESMLIGRVRVTLVEKSGRRARLSVVAPAAVNIVRPFCDPKRGTTQAREAVKP